MIQSFSLELETIGTSIDVCRPSPLDPSYRGGRSGAFPKIRISFIHSAPSDLHPFAASSLGMNHSEAGTVRTWKPSTANVVVPGPGRAVSPWRPCRSFVSVRWDGRGGVGAF